MKTATASSPPDPIVAAEVERAIAPYERLFPPDVVLTMREILEHALTSHPVGMALVDRVRPRQARDRSGAQPTGADAATPTVPAVKRAGSK